MRRNLAILALLATGLVASCSAGGDGSDDADPPRTTSTTKAPVSTTTTEDGPIVVGRWSYVTELRGLFAEQLPVESEAELADGDAASCLAEDIVDAFGEDRLEAAGVTPQDLSSGGFLASLDLTEAEEQELGSAIGDAYRDCGAMANILRDQFESEGMSATDEGIECAAAAVSPGLGATVLQSLDDPSIDGYQAGRDLAPKALASCPNFAVDVLAGIFEQEGQPFTDEQRACVLDAFTQAGKEHDELDQALLIQYARPCFGR